MSRVDGLRQELAAARTAQNVVQLRARERQMSTAVNDSKNAKDGEPNAIVDVAEAALKTVTAVLNFVTNVFDTLGEKVAGKSFKDAFEKYLGNYGEDPEFFESEIKRLEQELAEEQRKQSEDLSGGFGLGPATNTDGEADGEADEGFDDGEQEQGEEEEQEEQTQEDVELFIDPTGKDEEEEKEEEKEKEEEVEGDGTTVIEEILDGLLWTIGELVEGVKGVMETFESKTLKLEDEGLGGESESDEINPLEAAKQEASENVEEATKTPEVPEVEEGSPPKKGGGRNI